MSDCWDDEDLDMLEYDAFERGQKEYNKGYQQGREDAEAEHKAMCETCVHKVSAEDIKQIRADAIEKYRQALHNRAEEDEEKYSGNPFIGGCLALEEIDTVAEQIKEQK